MESLSNNTSEPRGSGAQFFKYQALGNDMIVVDPAFFSLPLTPEMIRRLCARHFGAGADGICYGPLSGQPHPHTMRFFNPDGSEAEKSGNGLRIFARYLWDAGYVTDKSYAIGIHDEIVPVKVLDEAAGKLSLGMGRLSFKWMDEVLAVGDEEVRGTAVSIGNPHFVIIADNLDTIRQLGPILETAPAFPNRTNVQMARIIDPHTIQIEIWERGAGYTLASGTSASAAAGTAVRLGHCQSPVTVRMAGGNARVEIGDDWDVALIGEVTAVYQGILSPDMY
ncbi:MAG: diaminopimelate epimerase [Chloroflexi bacterium]|nr:diaminopimelate epimerase [Chloroflexota bacterium]